MQYFGRRFTGRDDYLGQRFQIFSSQDSFNVLTILEPQRAFIHVGSINLCL